MPPNYRGIVAAQALPIDHPARPIAHPELRAATAFITKSAQTLLFIVTLAQVVRGEGVIPSQTMFVFAGKHSM